jgi:hypothetical protein
MQGQCMRSCTDHHVHATNQLASPSVAGVLPCLCVLTCARQYLEHAISRTLPTLSSLRTAASLPFCPLPLVDMSPTRRYATAYLEHYGHQLQGWVPVSLQGASTWQGPGVMGGHLMVRPCMTQPAARWLY